MFVVTIMFGLAVVAATAVISVWQLAARRQRSVREFMSDMEQHAAQPERGASSVPSH